MCCYVIMYGNIVINILLIILEIKISLRIKTVQCLSLIYKSLSSRLIFLDFQFQQVLCTIFRLLCWFRKVFVKRGSTGSSRGYLL